VSSTAVGRCARHKCDLGCMPAHDEEMFGPVVAVIRAADGGDAIRATDSAPAFGPVTSRGGGKFARHLACGSALVNGMVNSDPRLPFGGDTASGHGRDLSLLGIREFVNAKTEWIR
jgi:succinate-semialdehyde dehydrogenase/glutarate-semialdehyde dehydrogenase